MDEDDAGQMGNFMGANKGGGYHVDEAVAPPASYAQRAANATSTTAALFPPNTLSASLASLPVSPTVLLLD